VAFKRIQISNEIRKPAPPQTNGSRFGMCGRVSANESELQYRTPLITPKRPGGDARAIVLETLDYAAAAGAKHVTTLPGGALRDRSAFRLVATDLR